MTIQIEGKSMDEVLRFMFDRGTRFGARYPEYAAIPVEEREIQYRAMRDELAGNVWTPDQWLDARRSGLNENAGPHSRACGISQHDHGISCARDCPTCHGNNPDRRA
jgi:hypothetical protein